MVCLIKCCVTVHAKGKMYSNVPPSVYLPCHLVESKMQIKKEIFCVRVMTQVKEKCYLIRAKSMPFSCSFWRTWFSVLVHPNALNNFMLRPESDKKKDTFAALSVSTLGTFNKYKWIWIRWRNSYLCPTLVLFLSRDLMNFKVRSHAFFGG